MKIGLTKHYDLIPEDHRCTKCLRNKYEVAFTFQLRKSGNRYPKSICNECRYTKVETDGRSNPKKKPKVRVMSKKIREYFDEKI